MGAYTITESRTEDMYEFNKLSATGDNVKLSEDKKETKTLPGYSLLKDSISITIPKTLTAAEAKAQKADLSKGKYNEADDTYDFYDLVYKVTDHAIPGVPMTGAFDNWQTYVPIVIAMGLLIGVGIYEIKKKKSPKTENEEK